MCLAAALTHEEGNGNNLRERPYNSVLLTRLLGELRSGVHQASGSFFLSSSNSGNRDIQESQKSKSNQT